MTDDTPEQGDLLASAIQAFGQTLAENPPDDPGADDWQMDWHKGEEVIIQEQRSIAVYTNTKGGIVIREERGWDDENDTYIVLASRDAVETLIAALKREMGAAR